CDRRAGEGDEEEEDDEAGPCERELVAAKAEPDALPVAARADGLDLSGDSRFLRGDEVLGFDCAGEAGVLVELCRQGEGSISGGVARKTSGLGRCDSGVASLLGERR